MVLYWIGISVLGLIAVFALIMFIGMVNDGDEDAINAFPFIIVPALIIWGVVEWADYSEGKPIEHVPATVSIMHDDEVCIVRYKDFQETYSDKKEYDAILDSNFVLLETPTYDVLGEPNGEIYELKFDE